MILRIDDAAHKFVDTDHKDENSDHKITKADHKFDGTDHKGHEGEEEYVRNQTQSNQRRYHISI